MEPAIERQPTHAELATLARTHGEGFWLLSPARLRHNIAAFRAAFAAAGLPGMELSWSVKTQWLPVVLRTAFREGVAAEVVSAQELELAVALGADPSTLLFNGVGKTRADMERAFRLGSRIHLDSDDEVEDVLRIARDDPALHCRVGLRANVDLGLAGRGRFGLDAENGQLQAAWARLRKLANVGLEGLHLHVSGARRAQQFGLRMQRLLALSDELHGPGAHPAYLDLGGGFCGAMPVELAEQMPFTPPLLADYADAIAGPFRARWPSGGPSLVLEPGVALAADVMRFAAQVLAVKEIGGQRHAITSASVWTVKPMQHPMDMPFVHVPAPGARAALAPPTIVSGYTCMEADVLHGRSEQPLHRGDWLLFANCGAYTNVMTPRFIRAVPAVLMEEGDGYALAARAERVDDWLLASEPQA